MHEPGALISPPVRPRLSWYRKRSLLGSLIVLPLCLAVSWVYLVRSSDRQLREAITEADRLDPGWRSTERQKESAPILDEENSALVLLGAKGLVPPDWPFWNYPQASKVEGIPKLTALRTKLRNLEPPVQLDEDLTSALRQELQRAEKALLVGRKIIGLPRGRYPFPVTPYGLIGSATQMMAQDKLTIADVLAYHALVKAQDKDVDEALVACHGILNCGRSVGDEPSRWSMVLRIAVNQMATRQVERTLAQGEPSDRSLSWFQHDIEQEMEQPLLLLAARGERSGNDELLQAIQDGTLIGTFSVPHYSDWDLGYLVQVPGMIKRIRAKVLKLNNQLVEMAKLPVEQQVKRCQELEAAEQELPELARSLRLPPSITGFQRDRAELRCAVVMLAVERYRRANQRWPDVLTDLVPAYLPTVPLDPFDGAPLRYRRLHEGVVIYSIGPDRRDDGGNLDISEEARYHIFGPQEATKEGTDVGFRLWDVRHRRQFPTR